MVLSVRQSPRHDCSLQTNDMIGEPARIPGPHKNSAAGHRSPHRRPGSEPFVLCVCRVKFDDKRAELLAFYGLQQRVQRLGGREADWPLHSGEFADLARINSPGSPTASKMHPRVFSGAEFGFGVHKCSPRAILTVLSAFKVQPYNPGFYLLGCHNLI